jgi:pimeloyl-ACP methyl ester carboxylesterase
MAARWGARGVAAGVAGTAALGAGAALAWAGARAARRIAAVETLSPREGAPEGRFVAIDGALTHYVEAGSPGAPVALFLHGLGASTATWAGPLAALAGDYHVIALDLLGFGYSDRVLTPTLTLRRRAAQVVGLLDHLGVVRATLVGHSLGGAVALQVACGHPARVERLVLVDAVAGFDSKGRSPSPRLGAVLRRTPLGPLLVGSLLYDDARAVKLIGAAYADPARFTPERQAAYLAPRRVRGSAAGLLALTATRADDDLDTCLAGIAAPTLILWGRQDRFVKPAYGAQLHARLPHSRLELIEDCGHVPQEEQPEAFLALLRGFLAGDGG